MCDSRAIEWFKTWSEHPNQRKVIMDVIKDRLDFGWPYNYKSLDLLSIMPTTELTPLADKLKGFSESAASVIGSAELRKISKPLVDKVNVEIRKAEEEDARKRQDAITALWGGLWANHIGQPVPRQMPGWDGWQWSWDAVPSGVAPPGQTQGSGRSPEGWQPWVFTPYPTYSPTVRWPMP